MNSSFEQLLNVQNKSMTTSLTTFGSLFAAGVLLLLAKHRIGWFFLALSVAAGCLLYLKTQKFNGEIAKAGGSDVLNRQFGEAGTLHAERFGLTITRDFAVCERPSLKVYPLKEMQKFEVGLAGDVQKALFLTDFNGERHKIAETNKGDGSQEEFDRVYEFVCNYFAERK